MIFIKINLYCTYDLNFLIIAFYCMIEFSHSKFLCPTNVK